MQTARHPLFLFFTLLMFSGCGQAVESAESKPKDQQEKQGKFLGAMPTEYPAWFKESFLDFKEDVAEAAAAGKRLMVLFHQDGCPYCNALVERNLSQKDIEQTIRKHFDVVALNMWGDREVATIDGKSYKEKTFAAALKVQFTPTILFFNEQGKMILRLNGYLPPERFKVAINYIADKQEDKLSYQDYMAKHLPPGSSGEIYSEDFFLPKPYDLSRKPGKNKPFAIFFEQRDCPNCETLHKQILVDPELRKTIAGFDTVQLDMWSDTPIITAKGIRTTARQLAKQLDVKYAPTIVIFNERGDEVIRSEAFFKVFHTHGLFQYVASGSYAKQPSFQRYLSDLAHDIQATGKDVDIWHLENESPKN